MKAVFADTFYWVALTNPADPYNREAAAKSRELAQTTIITTDAVLTEFLTFFAEDAHWVIAPVRPSGRCSTALT